MGFIVSPCGCKGFTRFGLPGNVHIPISGDMDGLDGLVVIPRDIGGAII